VHALPPFTLSTITSKVVLDTPAEWADTFLLFLLYPSGRDPPMDEGTLKTPIPKGRPYWSFCMGGEAIL
jgi:hypothetical protein